MKVFFLSLVLFSTWLVSEPVQAGRGGDKPALQLLADNLHGKVSKALSVETHQDPVLALTLEANASILGKEKRLLQELERLLVFRLVNGSEVARVVPLGKVPAHFLLRVVVGVERERITATAELSPMHLPFWDRLVDPRPRGAKHHLFVSQKTDEEIGLLLGRASAPPPLGSWHLAELLSVTGRLLDLGMGDLDGDGKDELVLLFPDRIEVYSLQEAGVRRLTRFSLRQIPDSPSPSRDPVGSLLVYDFNRDDRAEVFLKRFSHRHGLILGWSGARLKELRRSRAVPLCAFRRGARPTILWGQEDPGKNLYSPQIEISDINSSKGEAHRLPSGFMALRCWQDPAGGIRHVLVVDTEYRLQSLEADYSSRRLMEGVGVAMAPVDFDQDKEPEWVLSDAVWPGEADALRVMAKGSILWKSRDLIGSAVAIAGARRSSGKSVAIVGTFEMTANNSRVYLLGR